MICKTFSWCGVGPLHRIDERMYLHVYKKILVDVMESYFFEKISVTFTFQQDPEYTSWLVKSNGVHGGKN